MTGVGATKSCRKLPASSAFYLYLYLASTSSGGLEGLGIGGVDEVGLFPGKELLGVVSSLCGRHNCNALQFVGKLHNCNV